MDDGDADIALAVENIGRNVRTVAPQQDIGAPGARRERADGDLVEKHRQSRLAEADLAGAEVELEAEAGLQQREGRGASPGLRNAGHRVERRAFARRAPRAAEELGKAAQI